MSQLFGFNEVHQESIKGFEAVSNYDLIIQNSQELVKAQRSDADLLDLIIDIGVVLMIFLVTLGWILIALKV